MAGTQFHMQVAAKMVEQEIERMLDAIRRGCDVRETVNCIFVRHLFALKGKLGDTGHDLYIQTARKAARETVGRLLANNLGISRQT